LIFQRRRSRCAYRKRSITARHHRLAVRLCGNKGCAAIGSHRQNRDRARRRGDGVRDHDHVVATLRHLHVGDGKSGIGRAVECRAIEIPLITEGRGSGRGDAEAGASAHHHALSLRLARDAWATRRFAFAGRSGGINRGDLVGRQRAIVKCDFVKVPREFVVPTRLARGAKIQRQRAVILGERYVRLTFKLAVHVEL